MSTEGKTVFSRFRWLRREPTIMVITAIMGSMLAPSSCTMFSCASCLHTDSPCKKKWSMSGESWNRCLIFLRHTLLPWYIPRYTSPYLPSENISGASISHSSITPHPFNAAEEEVEAEAEVEEEEVEEEEEV